MIIIVDIRKILLTVFFQKWDAFVRNQHQGDLHEFVKLQRSEKI